MTTLEQTNKARKPIRVGDTFAWFNHYVIVTDTRIDAENGREVATIKPLGRVGWPYGFPIDIYLDDYGLELAKGDELCTTR